MVFRNIHGTESARSTLRSFTSLKQGNEDDHIGGKYFLERLWKTLLGRRGENLPDITKSRDTSMDNKKQNSFLFTSCHFTLR